MFDPSLMGRLSFTHTAPTQAPLPPGRQALGLREERDAMLYVPQGLTPGAPVPLMVMFHGAGGSAERVLPFLEQHAEQNRFLLLAPQSTYPTWDIVIGGNGPDIQQLDITLAKVASHFLIDREHF